MCGWAKASSEVPEPAKVYGSQCGGAVATNDRPIQQFLRALIVLNPATPSESDLHTVHPPSALLLSRAQRCDLLAIGVVQHEAAGLVWLVQPHFMVLRLRPFVHGTLLCISSQDQD